MQSESSDQKPSRPIQVGTISVDINTEPLKQHLADYLAEQGVTMKPAEKTGAGARKKKEKDGNECVGALIRNVGNGGKLMNNIRACHLAGDRFDERQLGLLWQLCELLVQDLIDFIAKLHQDQGSCKAREAAPAAGAAGEPAPQAKQDRTERPEDRPPHATREAGPSPGSQDPQRTRKPEDRETRARETPAGPQPGPEREPAAPAQSKPASRSQTPAKDDLDILIQELDEEEEARQTRAQKREEEAREWRQHEESLSIEEENKEERLAEQEAEPPTPPVVDDSWLDAVGLSAWKGNDLEKYSIAVDKEIMFDFERPGYVPPREMEPLPGKGPGRSGSGTGGSGAAPPASGGAAPPASGGAAPPPSAGAAPEPSVIAQATQPTAQTPAPANPRLGLAPLLVVAGVAGQDRPASAMPRKSVPPALRLDRLDDDGIEYRPEPPPRFGLAVPLPPDWGDDIATAPLLNLAAIAGCTEVPPQFGLLGRRFKTSQPIALNYNDCFALGYFGVPNSGKSYALALTLEGGLCRVPLVNHLRAPLCGISLHYHPNASYDPQLLAGVRPNSVPGQVETLLYDYRVMPQPFPDVLVLTLPEQVQAMRQRHRHAQVHGIKFPLRELGADGLRILLGLLDRKRPLYALQLQELLQSLRDRLATLTFRELVRAIRDYPFTPAARKLLIARLRLVRRWIDDSRSLRDYIKPGRLIQVDIRSEWLEAEQAMTLFGLVTSALVMHPDRSEGVGCNVILAYDEAHKFAQSPLVAAQMATLVKERRHLRASVVLASQDPTSLPAGILPLLDGIGVFQHEAPAWSECLGRANAALKVLTPEVTSVLRPGMMWLWMRHWCMVEREVDEGEDGEEGEEREEDQVREDFTGRPILVETRPLAAQHGGATRQAVPREDGAVPTCH